MGTSWSSALVRAPIMTPAEVLRYPCRWRDPLSNPVISRRRDDTSLVGFDPLLLEHHAPLRDFFLQVSGHLLGCAGDYLEAVPLLPALESIRRLERSAHFLGERRQDRCRCLHGRREHVPGREFITRQGLSDGRKLRRVRAACCAR